jgi:uncharacterized protein (UPF0261 family)
MNNKKPNIICMGILDTKGDEIKYLAGEVKRYGGTAEIMELSLGAEVGWADITLSEILKETGQKKEDVFKASRTEAVQLIGKAGAIKIKKMFDEGKVDGVITWAGSIGSSVSAMVMRALPIGVPKILLSTLAAGDVSSWLGSKDIYIANPVSEKGINRVTVKLIANAIAGLIGMAKVGEVTKKTKPLAAITAYGTTTPTVMKCIDFIQEKGWDTIIIHQVGTGATMEDLIRSGLISAIYDITIGEISNNYYNSIYGIDKDWEGERLTAASDMGIPQIVCPGGLAQSAFGPLKSVPEEILNDFKTGKRQSYQNSKEMYIHNSAVTIISPTIEETELFGREVINKLNNTKGPTILAVPMKGWSAYDQSAELATVERGWAKEKGDGPVWIPDPDKPEWSLRAVKMTAVFEKLIDRSNDNLDLIQCDSHILDEDFVKFLNNAMVDMIDKKWKKGMYRDLDIVIK